jgi:hypothetical protein
LSAKLKIRRVSSVSKHWETGFNRVSLDDLRLLICFVVDFARRYAAPLCRALRRPTLPGVTPPQRNQFPTQPNFLTHKTNPKRNRKLHPSS